MSASSAVATANSSRGRLFQAYGLNSRFAKEFDLEEIAGLFESKYGYKPTEVKVTAGGGTCLAGPVK